MITEEELKMSNKSFTNKDFGAIYTELLDIASKISPRWNPATSNESDPGVVLLKLAAFIGDKLNYNIDKNVLECFMPSATQESSMRRLCEMNGYTMKYYNSATTEVSFIYRGELASGDSITIPKYAVVTDIDSSIKYTLLKEVTISRRGVTVTVDAIQGTTTDLTIGGSDTILLENIDDNERLYLNDVYVAENGVYVTDALTGEAWTRVTNLNTQKPNSKVFKFSYDTVTSSPYLEFPDDIANLIGSGIKVKYIVTDGVNGNISANFLTQLVDTSIKTDNGNDIDFDSLSISNGSATSNGRNPETIDEAYNSFKKVVGTFDTLVTCRDYANAIYNLTDPVTNDPLVSNVQVSDRRTDLNYSCNIKTYGINGEYLQAIEKDNITPFDLCVYALTPIVTTYTYNTYKSSFTPLLNTLDVELGIEDLKTMSHNYKEFSDDDIYLIKNNYRLNAKISTLQKVNTFEQATIIANVQNAIYENFNARMVDYGTEIPYDTLLNIITNADARIKVVSLEEPVLVPSVVHKNNTEDPFLTTVDTPVEQLENSPYLKVVAKNVLEGKISLFDYNEDFDYDFGQSSSTLSNSDTTAQEVGSPLYYNIYQLGSEVIIPSSEFTGGNQYTLKQNEVIQAIAPNLTNEISFTAYVNYRYNSDNPQIDANTDYLLQPNEELLLEYQDSASGEYIRYRYVGTNGEIWKNDVRISTGNTLIFRPNFNLKSWNNRGSTELGFVPTYYNGSTRAEDYRLSLSAKEQIDKRNIVETRLTSSEVPCFWVLPNRTDGRLFSADDENNTGSMYVTILGDNEYFVYTDAARTSLTILGSGTKLSISKNTDLSIWQMDSSNVEMSEEDLSSISNTLLQSRNFSTNNLVITEMQIVTVANGDSFTINSTNQIENLNNLWQTLDAGSSLSYTIDDTTSTITSTNVIKWQVRSRLDVICGPSTPQELLDNQTIYIRTKVWDDELNVWSDEKEYKITKQENENTSFKLNENVTYVGNNYIDIPYIQLTDSISYPMTALVFDKTSVELKDNGTVINPNVQRTYGDFMRIGFNQIDSNTGSLDMPLLQFTNGESQVMMFWNHSDTEDRTVTLTCSDSAAGLRFYNQGQEFANSITLHEGVNNIELDTSKQYKMITLSFSGANSLTDSTDFILINKLSAINGINPRLGLKNENEVNAVLKMIDTEDINKDGDKIFYYTNTVTGNGIIDADDLSDPRALWDVDNIANRFVLPCIDIDNSSITIVSSSRL